MIGEAKSGDQEIYASLIFLRDRLWMQRRWAAI